MAVITNFMMRVLHLRRARHSGLQSRDSITEEVALGVKAQEGFGYVEFGVLGRRGSALWKGYKGLRSNPTLERGRVQECCPKLHRILGDGAGPRTQDLDSPWGRAPLRGWEKTPLWVDAAQCQEARLARQGWLHLCAHLPPCTGRILCCHLRDEALTAPSLPPFLSLLLQLLFPSGCQLQDPVLAFQVLQGRQLWHLGAAFGSAGPPCEILGMLVAFSGPHVSAYCTVVESQNGMKSRAPTLLSKCWLCPVCSSASPPIIHVPSGPRKCVWFLRACGHRSAIVDASARVYLVPIPSLHRYL